MKDATIAREVRALAWPAIVGSLLQTLVFVVDRVMLGRHGHASLAGMQIAGPLEWSIFSVVSAFEVGALARVGRHVGAGKLDAARKATVLSLLIAFVAGVLLAVATPAVLALVRASAPRSSEAAIAEGTAYLAIMLPASPAVFVATAAIAVLQGRGDTRTPLVVSGIANVLHVALNTVLVLGAFGFPAMGARGAAISTAITFLLQAIVLSWVLSRRIAGEVPEARLFADVRVELDPLVRLGLPAFGERVLYHVGYLGYSAMVAQLGDEAMAANQALISIESVCFLSADGFAIAAAAVVAQHLGRGEHDAAAEGAKVATTYSVATLTTLGVLAWLARAALFPVFTKEPSVVALGLATMPILALAQPFMGNAVVRAQALRGAGATGRALGVTLIGAVLVRLAATYAFAFVLGLGLVGVWLGSTVDWIVRTVLFRWVSLPKEKVDEPVTGEA